MPEEAKAPLYEGANIERVLITGVDRMEHDDPGIYTFVGTVGGSVSGVQERRVCIYLDATPNAIVEGLLHLFTGAAHLVAKAARRRLSALGSCRKIIENVSRPTQH